MGLVARNTERPKGGGVGVAGHVTFLNGFGERLALGAKREWKERHKEIHLPPGIATKSFANAISKFIDAHSILLPPKLQKLLRNVEKTFAVDCPRSISSMQYPKLFMSFVLTPGILPHLSMLCKLTVV